MIDTNLPEFSFSKAEAAMARQDQLTKPPGSLGRLEEISVKLAGIQNTNEPLIRNSAIIVAAASHGIAARGVSAFPSSVTEQMVLNFLNGTAAINVLAKSSDSRVFVVDAGVDADFKENSKLIRSKVSKGTSDFSKEFAMSKNQAEQIVKNGIEFVQSRIAGKFEVIAIGDMGIGNTTCASAITAAVTSTNTKEVTGRGTVINDKSLENKKKLIVEALLLHKPNSLDPIDILSKVGGYEIGFLCGCILGAAKNRIATVLDGFPTTAAGLLALLFNENIRNYLLAGHRSQEPGHKIALNFMGLKPILDLDMRLGEGSGAALALPIIKSSCDTLNEMLTFEDAAVDKSNEV